MEISASSNSSIPSVSRVFSATDNLENNLKRLVKICYKEFRAFEERTKIQNKRHVYTKPNRPSVRTNDRVFVFPESDINEVLQIMEKLNIDKIGVVKHLWNKEIIGYMYRNDIEDAIKSGSKKYFPKDLISKEGII